MSNNKPLKTYSIKYKNQELKFITNNSKSKKMIIFFHGLDGSATFAKPLFNKLSEYKVVAMEQRGHMHSTLKPSRSIQRHLNDYQLAIEYFYKQGYKIWIMGESMGAAYVILLALKYPQMIQSVFAQSIPNKLVNVFQTTRLHQLKIQILTIIAYLTNINFSYKTKVNYEKFSNSKTLHRLARIADQTKKRNIRETLATWAANKRVWRKLKSKESKIAIYYFQPTSDIVNNIDKVRKIFSKNKKNLHLFEIEGAKHILTYEPQFDQVIFKIKDVIGKP